jgi:hypothetical protein
MNETKTFNTLLIAACLGASLQCLAQHTNEQYAVDNIEREIASQNEMIAIQQSLLDQKQKEQTLSAQSRRSFYTAKFKHASIKESLDNWDCEVASSAIEKTQTMFQDDSNQISELFASCKADHVLTQTVCQAILSPYQMQTSELGKEIEIMKINKQLRCD